MAEHHLYGAKIRAAIEQVCCEAVTQHVRRERLPERGLAAVGAEQLPEDDAVELGAPLVEKKIRRRIVPQQLRAGRAQIFPDHRKRLLADGNQTFLIALANAAKT